MNERSKPAEFGDLAVLKRLRNSESVLRDIEAIAARRDSHRVAESSSSEGLSLATRIDRLEELATQSGPLRQELAALQAELAGIRNGTVYRVALAVATVIKRPRTLLKWTPRLRRFPRLGQADARPLVEMHEVTLPAEVETLEGDVLHHDVATLVPLPSAPGRPSRASEMRIAAICDPFTAQGLEPECECAFLKPDTWIQQVSALRPHILFVESAWTGLQGEWAGKVSGTTSELRSILESCRAAGIPTFFWNKEDPLHFEAFLATARLFDHVCTTDAASIPRYKRELGHGRVHLLPFAVQPRLHHPVMQPGEVRKSASFFAGAWYGRHPERCRNFIALADALALVGPLRIYDRNAGDADPMRRYPDRYRSFLCGSIGYEQTPAVQRQHRIGLTVNTIKHSPTMFARRAIELMATNTAVYSNHSRALGQLFGDLLVATDDGERALEMAFDETRSPDSLRHRVRRLIALRKVLEQYTWDERLDSLAELAWSGWERRASPTVAVVGCATEPAQVENLVAMVRAQRGVEVSLWIAAPQMVELPSGVHRLTTEMLGRTPAEVLGADLVAPWHPGDLYGPDYLRDLMLAHKFDQGCVTGKAAYHSLVSGDCQQQNPDREYRHVNSLALRRVMMPITYWLESLDALVHRIPHGQISDGQLLSIDGLSYLEHGAGQVLPQYVEEAQIDEGSSLADVTAFVAKVPGAPSLSEAGAESVLDGAALASLFNNGHVPPRTSASPRRHRLELVSALPPGREDAMFSGHLHPRVIERNGRIELCLDARPHPGFDAYLDALDASGRIIRRERLPPEVNVSLECCEDATAYRLALSVRGPFVTHVDGLWLRPRPVGPLTLPGSGRILLVVNGYPSDGNLYRNAFVHRRVLAYKARGVGVDVVWVSDEERPGSFEFQGVPVIVCSPDALRATLQFANYRAIAVHFLDQRIWQALRDAARHTRTVVWLHGAEIQPWHRRAFNYRTDAERDYAMAASHERMSFWRELLSDMPDLMHLVFVSRTFAAQTWDDLGVQLDRTRWSVIPNPIDTGIFQYQEKSPDQRYRVLSIRPHASWIYANDLIAEAIDKLSKRPDFPAWDFTLVGDGPLWEENFARLAAYPNVKLFRTFLRQEEVATLHRQHGVFLVPSRGDTQGVSRDEAMASGLVPVTCAVGAIPEFVDDESGILCPPDDSSQLAESLGNLGDDPTRFLGLSSGAAASVKGTRCHVRVARMELEVLGASPK